MIATSAPWLMTYFLTRQDVRAELDLAESALAERLDQYIVTNCVLRLGWTGLPGRSTRIHVASAALGGATFRTRTGSFLVVVGVTGVRVPRLLLRLLLAPMSAIIQIV